ncbi:MAG TPA: Dabb family protein [Verrucomicrobiales bacterium]|nr:Dabb family protein [Verrucomicrobiales bacterium]
MTGRFLLLLGVGTALMALGAADEAGAEEAKYRHVVLFKFKDDAPAEAVQRVEQAFIALKDKVDLVREFEWGKNVSPEGLNQGFTHCFFVTFDSKEDLEKYLPHPEHEKFVSLLKPHLDKVLVVDYVTGG